MKAEEVKQLKLYQKLDWVEKSCVVGKLVVVDICTTSASLEWQDGEIIHALPFTHMWWKQIELPAK